MHKNVHSYQALLLALSLILGGCAGDPVTLGSAQHDQLLVRDRAAAEQGQVLQISLAEALGRGVERNLDARVAAMEVLVAQGTVTLDEINALPSIKGSNSHVRRSNDGATSSRSVLSGLQSLEPSQSTDEERRVLELSTSWNLLDAVLALSEADSARESVKISGERYAKVVQNIERDIYAAYWRALVFQQNRGASESLLNEGEEQSDKLTKAVDEKLLSVDAASDKISRLTERQRSLQEIYDRLSLSQYELKGLLSLPQGTNLALLSPSVSQEKAYQPILAGDVSAQEWQALKSRPEMREDILQKNIALDDIRREVIKTFPGGELLFSYNRDGNQFLQQGDWTIFSASIAQNILNIFTLPFRYSAAKDKATLADAKRQALSAAILAQVHIARQRLGNSEKVYKNSVRSSKVLRHRSGTALAAKETGFSSGYDSLITRMDGQIDLLRSQMAMADLQDSYAAMVGTLGGRLSESGGVR